MPSEDYVKYILMGYGMVFLCQENLVPYPSIKLKKGPILSIF